ncbi:MAG: site-specific integrase [Chloroflexi bacterium]|nr:site-specific integrase [Chloroflexota bacterium]
MSALATSPAQDPPETINQAGEVMLTQLELSPLTKRTYRHGLNALVRYFHSSAGNYQAADELAPVPLSEITEETLASFNVWLREAYPDSYMPPKNAHSHAATRTSRTYLVAARRLMNWLDLRDLLPPGITYERMARRIDEGRGQRREGYKQRKVDPEVMRVLTHYLRQPLPEKPGMARLTLLRNRCLMALLYDTGMRISEALALSREDVLDGRATRLRLVVTKNGKPRTVFLSEDTRQLIADYTRERQDSLRAPLFVSHRRGLGRAISPSHAWLLVKKAAEAEGLYASTSPHSLRHRRAQDLLNEGMPLEWVAALLGHQHPDTTRVVYAWETEEERLADMVATYGRSPTDVASPTESSRDD